MSGPPVVGIVGHGVDVRRPWGELPMTAAATSYVTALGRAGLRAVVLPGDRAAGLLDVVDALVLTGGGDLDPRRSGAGAATEVCPERDDVELALVAAAREASVPVLGICRGLQVLVVAEGGRLRDGVDHVRPSQGHVVRTGRGSLVRRLVGAEVLTTALHHQAIDHPGMAWRATAWTDDVIEAVEPTDATWPALGVQWHPELDGVRGFRDRSTPAVLGWLSERAHQRQRRRRRPVGH